MQMYPSGQNNALTDVLNVISDIAGKVAGGGYIFRGETQHWQKISSRLYRDYKNLIDAGQDVEAIQRIDLENARRFTRETDDLAILAEIQHYGGSTNLIDFTYDYLIALFFACDGAYADNGRVILLDMSSEISPHICIPQNPENRIIAQKSVFVRPPAGYITTNRLHTVDVPYNLKQPMLDYLRNNHGISAESIYNDLHGFIKYRAIHHETFEYISKGFIHHNNREHPQAIDNYTEALKRNPQMDYVYVSRGNAYLLQSRFYDAIIDYSKAIELNLNHAEAYYKRGEARLFLKDWGNAKSDLSIAKNIGWDIASAFRNTYQSVDNFQKRYGIPLPLDIKQLLGG